ncbi:MAG TPA: trehalose-phosphatase, partial [Gammaproteobacteria bacterium]|nr:trehalose-phosphatase [Gammaproteobacteria bacterium]
MSTEPCTRPSAQDLPHALSDRRLLEQVLDQQPLQVFLDYDGTLSPIVSHPQDALLGSDMRAALQRLAGRHPTAVISGRELADVRARVGLPQLYYAGNHGFEIAGPPGSGIDWEFGSDYVDELDDLYQAFAIQLPPLDGLIIEHKRYSLSVHYRLVANEAVPALEHALSGLLAERP